MSVAHQVDGAGLASRVAPPATGAALAAFLLLPVAGCGRSAAATAPSLAQRLALLDGAAVQVWQRQVALAGGAVAVDDAEEARTGLYVDLQRLRAGAARVAFTATAGPRLEESVTRVYLEAAPGGAVRERWAHERVVVLSDGEAWLPILIDRRFDAVDDGRAPLLRIASDEEPAAPWPLFRQAARPLYHGTAFDAARLVLPREVVRDAGRVTLLAARSDENRAGVGLYHDFETEFAAPPVRMEFRLYVDENGAEPGRAPRAFARAIAVPPDEHAADGGWQPRPCRRAPRIPWPTDGSSPGHAVSVGPPRAGWDCSFAVEDEAARAGLVLARVELPYPGCPRLRDVVHPGSP